MTQGSSLSTLVNAGLLVVLAGFLLLIGKSVLLPILAAVIVVYVLVSASEALTGLPGMARVSPGLRRFFVLMIFAGVLLALTGVVLGTIGQIVTQAPAYQANIERLVAQGADAIGIDERPDWETIRNATIGRLSVRNVIETALANVTWIGASVFLVIVYSAFLLTERASFAAKLSIVLPDPEDRARTEAIIRDINDRIGDYLAIKTLINVILGAMSFVVLWGFGVDFPLFWALAIALLNYIPYLGSLVGVAMPVALSVVQFGQLGWTLALGALLVAAQVWVGSFLEPRMIGRRVNLSPFVVLASLAIWTSLWGLPGALLAVPLTSMLTIVLSAFAPTRPFAVLMANRVAGREIGEL
ncbi:AI-2E family transporter [Jannaschia rubra]|uniref:AI-2E family transporter n=1 Tax=Jannaschia rubra TaxID=282197 RepID=UPI002490FC62|nr:AI-2E family transporter [Jannaschia rubra]